MEARRQREAVDWIQANGGHVRYDWNTDENGQPVATSFSSGCPKWFEELIGRDYLQTATHVHFSGKDLTDINALASLPHLRFVRIVGCDLEDVTPLASLTDLRYLWLIKNRIEDLAPVASMAELRLLRADMNSIADVEPLMKLGKLKVVSLTSNPLTYEGLEKLHNAHPNCQIRPKHQPVGPSTLGEAMQWIGLTSKKPASEAAPGHRTP